MHLLQSGVDMAVIALWLGHEDLDTTHIYMEADLALKEKAQQPPASRAKCASLQSLRQSAGVPGHSIIMYTAAARTGFGISLSGWRFA
jgi:hypothetical protein